VGKLTERNDNLTHHRIDSDARIDGIGAAIRDLLHQNRKIEQNVQWLKDGAETLPPALQKVQDQVTLIEDTNKRLLVEQSFYLRYHQERAIKNELATFQRLLVGADSDRMVVKGELRRLNARLDQLGVSHNLLARRESLVVEREITEFQCLLFKYKYERHGPRPSSRAQGTQPSLTGERHQETTWLRVKIPSWFLESQWAISVVKATGGWQYSLRMYRVLPNDAAIFDLCIRGDIAAVKKKVVCGEVSIYDQNESGHTLLHVSFSTSTGSVSVY
jgi:hypothetical protein